MSTILDTISSHEPGTPSIGSTLLNLVLEMNATTDSPCETVDRVLAALDDGAVHLTGNFRGHSLI